MNTIVYTSSSSVSTHLIFPLKTTHANTRRQMNPATEQTTISIKVFVTEIFKELAAFCTKKRRKK